MKVTIINSDGKEEVECLDMSFEGGFVVLKTKEDTELFLSSAKCTIMEVIGRKKKQEKPKVAKKSE